MVNGKEGDHPITDVVRYGKAVFGDPIDDLIRQLDDFGEWKSYITANWALEQYGAYLEALQSGDRQRIDGIRSYLRFSLETELQRLRDETRAP
jgi:hypothetical protein